MGQVRGPVAVDRGAGSVYRQRAVQSRWPQAIVGRCYRRPGATGVQAGGADVDAARVWAGAERAGARRQQACITYRHRVARRHGVHQSRRLGEPARIVRARREGRSVPQRENPLDLQLGFFTEGTTYRTRHRRDEPVHPDVGARPVAFDQWRAAAAHRHPVRPLHPARPRCAELCLLPGRAFHGRGDAVGRRRRASRWRRKAARTSRSPRP